MRHTAVLIPLALLAATGACDLDTFRATPLRPPADLMETMHVSRDDLETTRSGLQRADVEVGTGTEATPGRVVVVHYTGRLTNGDTFDSSRKRDEPFSFTLGAGEVIQGWDEGVAGMRVGGKRALVIPPSLGYGGRAGGPIPANSTLVFDVELLEGRCALLAVEVAVHPDRRRDQLARGAGERHEGGEASAGEAQPAGHQRHQRRGAAAEQLPPRAWRRFHDVAGAGDVGRRRDARPPALSAMQVEVDGARRTLGVCAHDQHDIPLPVCTGATVRGAPVERRAPRVRPFGGEDCRSGHGRRS